MAEITYISEGGVLTISPNGHIDSTNAADSEAKILEATAAYPGVPTVIDCDKLSYISSVGLRIILRLRKANKDLKLVNVTPEVYEVFEMTGFTEMMDIEKGYRKVSIDGCEAIGQGSNGVVYRLDPDTIIKVYRNPDSLPDIHRERELARKALILGIPTAIPYDIVKVGNSYGSVFELLNAKSFAKIVKEDPSKLEEITVEFVRLLKQIHSTDIKKGDMPETKSVALGWARDLRGIIPDDKQEKLCSLIEAIPECDKMMHGDYHFKNVMVQNGEVLLIDMDTLSVGNPVFEFASIYLANVGFGEVNPEGSEKFMGLPYDMLNKVWSRTLELYFEGKSREEIENYAQRARVIGYTRLLRRTVRREKDNVAQIEHCREMLCKLLERVDELAY